MATNPPSPPIQVKVRWQNVEDVPILLANQLMAQVLQDEIFVITLGQVAPPAVTGTPDEQAEQLLQMGPIPIRPLARLSIPHDRLREMVASLTQVLELYESEQRSQE